MCFHGSVFNVDKHVLSASLPLPSLLPQSLCAALAAISVCVPYGVWPQLWTRQWVPPDVAGCAQQKRTRQLPLYLGTGLVLCAEGCSLLAAGARRRERWPF